MEDSNNLNNLRLLIKDYPYAVDGLAIWWAIESWVTEYCSIYYPDNKAVVVDAGSKLLKAGFAAPDQDPALVNPLPS